MTPLVRTLVESSLRISVVAGAVGSFLLLARVRSSELRHKAWVAVLAAMLLMPALPNLVPPPVQVQVPIVASERLPEIAYVEPLPMPVETAAPPKPGWSWVRFGMAAYAGVLLAMLGRLLVGWIAVRRLVRRSRRVEGQGVCESDAIATPLTVGVLRPSVLLPGEWRDWSQEKLSAVLAHEFAHVRRRDTLTSFVAHLNRCVFWFHPLAWWLERHLASVAEQACDDAGIHALGESRKYAEVLLDIAETASHAGRRISWQGVGVDGTGMLGARIDRVLRGKGLFAKVTRKQKWIVASGCAGAILVAAACQQSIYSQPLKPDPQETAREQNMVKRLAEYNAARNMVPQEIAAAEAEVRNNPEDLATRNKLIFIYQTKREWWDLAAPHQIWLVEHHPEEKNAWLFAKLLSPASLERLKTAWHAKAARVDAREKVLWNAEMFFETEAYDYPAAESLVLRLNTEHPNLQYRRTLGRIYAMAITQGNASPEFKAHASEELDKSKDPVTLASAGADIARNFGALEHIKPELVAKGTSYLNRALEIDPASQLAKQGLENAGGLQDAARKVALLGPPSADEYARLSNLSEAEQCRYLPDVARDAYIQAQGSPYRKQNPVNAKHYFELADRYAKQMLSMCADHKGEAGYADAYLIGSATALELNHDKAPALKYLGSNDQPRTGAIYLTFRLLGALLRYGGPEERKAVIEYCERSRGELAKSAEQLRKGVMPPWYQSQLASIEGLE